MNAQGAGKGAILNSQYGLVNSSNPAQAGDIILIYATGLGAVTNQPATGSPAPSSHLSWTTTTPTVTIGGAPATVIFSGLAPGYAGLYQVNAQVLDGLAPGLAVAVTISMGRVSSNTVTMAAGSFPHYVISTIAGGSGSGYSGDGGLAVNAQLSSPSGLALDYAGNLYIADSGNYRIRKVSDTGIITTVAGNFIYPGYSGDGGPAINAQLGQELFVAADNSGDIYIADTQNNRIREVSAADGLINTVAGWGLARGSSNGVGDGGPAVSAELNAPTGIAEDASGNLYIADSRDGRIRRVSAATGIITTVAGDGLQNCGGSQPCVLCGNG